jgi:hypothetical protein
VAIFTPEPKAAKRALEFFTAQIHSNHTRMAYLTRRGALPNGARSTASANSPA